MPNDHVDVSIPEYYSGKHLFITGGSGYMGKCLIEKLLRTCPNIGNIYMLLRPKRGVSISERLEKFVNDFAFRNLRNINEDALKKIIPVCGDTSKLKLGLSEEDRETIIKNASIVYHFAATVQFDHPLKEAILINVRGTRELCHLVLKINTVSAFIHVSTTYSQCDKINIEEKLYPLHADWREAIEVAENVNGNLLKLITRKYVGNLPNTYTFTKSLAEHVINDMCNGQIPTTVFRPSIVFSAISEPYPGYTDNFNGPMVIVCGIAKGILRTLYVDAHKKLSYIPIDTATKGLVIATWTKGSEKKMNPISWYSASGKNILSRSNTELFYAGAGTSKSLIMKHIWLPVVLTSKSEEVITQNFIIFYLNFMLFQLIPALLTDVVLKLLRKPPLHFGTIQRKIYLGCAAVAFFAQNEWNIVNDKFLDLENRLLNEDKLEFSYKCSELNFETILRDCLLYCEEAIFRTNMQEQAKMYKTHKRNLWIAYYSVKYIFILGIIWLFYTLFFTSILSKLAWYDSQ